MRRVHFEVEGLRFDGAKRAIVTVETGANKAAAIIRVRAHSKPREVVMLLSDVAQILLERDARALAAQNASAKRGRR